MRILMFVGLMLSATTAALSEERELDIASAVEKSLPLLQQSAETYTKNRDCFSCHHQALTNMTVALAKSRGFQVDAKGAKAQSEFTIRYFHERKDRVQNGSGVPGGPYTAGYALVSLADDQWLSDETTAALVQYLQKKQTPAGGWRIFTHRPPLEDSHFTATALALRGLQRFAKKQDQDELAERIAKARKWLIDTDPKTHEDKVFRLMGLRWSGADAEAVKKSVDQLISEQREDGGWAQLAKMDSDAYATGQALVTLHRAGGIAVSAEVYQRGVTYLLKCQLNDGSWLVKTRSKPIQRYFESGFPHEKSQFISISGTCWATMALVLASDGKRANRAK